MLGNFTGSGAVEWNVLMDIPSAQLCVAEMPVPVVFVPWEIGGHIITGHMLETVGEDHPVRAAYTLYADGKHHTRMSWDPITVYCAVRKDTPLYRREPLHAVVDTRGETVAQAGNDMVCIVQAASDAEIVAAIDPLML